jgi:hypothetical protein
VEEVAILACSQQVKMAETKAVMVVVVVQVAAVIVAAMVLVPAVETPEVAVVPQAIPWALSQNQNPVHALEELPRVSGVVMQDMAVVALALTML